MFESIDIRARIILDGESNESIVRLGPTRSTRNERFDFAFAKYIRFKRNRNSSGLNKITRDQTAWPILRDKARSLKDDVWKTWKAFVVETLLREKLFLPNRISRRKVFSQMIAKRFGRK